MTRTRSGPVAASKGKRGATGPVLTIHVIGVPAPQGSKNTIVNQQTGRASVQESSKKLQPWRQDVKQAALDAVELATLANEWPGPLTDVDIDVTFLMPRPRSHYRTGQHRDELRPGAPHRHTGRPDIDKLTRALLDVLTVAAVIKDDANVAEIRARKHYTSGHTGAVICVYQGSSATSPAARHTGI